MPRFSATPDLHRCVDAASGAVLFAAEAGLMILAALWLAGSAVGFDDGVLPMEIALASVAAVALCVILTLHFYRNLRDLEASNADSD